jgi:hypothetical protein
MVSPLQTMPPAECADRNALYLAYWRNIMRTSLLALAAVLSLMPKICAADNEYRDFCLESQAIMESVRQVSPEVTTASTTPAKAEPARQGQVGKILPVNQRGITAGPTATIANETGV